MVTNSQGRRVRPCTKSGLGVGGGGEGGGGGGGERADKAARVAAVSESVAVSASLPATVPRETDLRVEQVGRILMRSKLKILNLELMIHQSHLKSRSGGGWVMNEDIRGVLDVVCTSCKELCCQMAMRDQK